MLIPAFKEDLSWKVRGLIESWCSLRIFLMKNLVKLTGTVNLSIKEDLMLKKCY